MSLSSKKIIFLLPGVDRDSKTGEYVPVGGYKVVYQYANMFAEDGYEVEIAYSHARCHYDNPLKYLHSFIGYYYRKVRGQLHPGIWFSFNNRVRRCVYYRFSRPWFNPSGNSIIIATAYDTAVELNNMKHISHKHKTYFIQDHEIWCATEEDLAKTYNYGFKNIAIAPWLQEIISKSGATSQFVTNGFDFHLFHLDNPIECRNKFEIVMLNHTLEHKRCQDAWAAICQAKKTIPDIHVTMFGTCDQPADMPEWCTYYRNPAKDVLTNIYNNGAIYVAASDFEGFGLTIGEAMICGCAVACTNNGGFSCMVKNKETGLLSDVYDVNALSRNIITLIEDNNLRISLARSGNKFIQQFNWVDSYSKFRKILESME